MIEVTMKSDTADCRRYYCNNTLDVNSWGTLWSHWHTVTYIHSYWLALIQVEHRNKDVVDFALVEAWKHQEQLFECLAGLMCEIRSSWTLLFVNPCPVCPCRHARMPLICSHCHPIFLPLMLAVVACFGFYQKWESWLTVSLCFPS